MQRLRKIWDWFEDRTGTLALVKPYATHPVPPGARWWYVFGSATLTAFIIQVLTGIGLALVYVPSTADAYNTLQFITHKAWLGPFLRAMHYFGASAMFLLLGIHMIRVFLMGAFKYPREMSWLSGVLLLGLTAVMGFTGQLLRWDQNAVWTAYVAAEQFGRVPFIGKLLAHFILAGDSVGGATLTRFYAFHVFFVPALFFAAIPLHLYLVVRNGISEPPDPARPVDRKTYRTWYEEMLRREGVPFWPSAAWRDAVFSVVVVVALAALAYAIGPPLLGEPPNPTILKAEPRPDWYFMWYFALLALSPHGLEQYVMVVGPLLAAVVLLLLPFMFNQGERHPRRRPVAIGAVLMIVLSIGTLWWAAIKAPWSPDFKAQALSAAVIGTDQGPVFEGAQIAYKKGCLYCHHIANEGGHRGPDLTTIGDRLTSNQMIRRIMNGGYNMPGYANNLTPAQLDRVVKFLQSRTTRSQRQTRPMAATQQWSES